MSIFVHVHLKLPGNDPEGALSDVREALGEGLDEFDYESLSVAKSPADEAAPEAKAMAVAEMQKVAAPIVALPFKVDQMLTADGDKLHGKVKVIACWNAKSADKPQYDRPNQAYPQVEVMPVGSRRPWHFNGDDIRQGKLIAQ